MFNAKKMEKYPKEIAIRLFSHVAKYWIQYVGDNIESFRKFECLTSVIPGEPDYWGIIDDDNDEKLLVLYQNMCDFYIADQMIWNSNDPELVKLLKPYPDFTNIKRNKSNSDFGSEIERISRLLHLTCEKFHSLDQQFKTKNLFLVHGSMLWKWIHLRQPNCQKKSKK